MSSSEIGTASREDDSASDTCSICLAYEQEGRLRWSKSNVAASAVVHQACPECDAFKVDESQLCDFCIHIRPAHLMTCRCVLDFYDKHVPPSKKNTIVIGTLSQLKSRQGSCAFCRWCLEVVEADVRLHQSIIDDGKAIRIQRSPGREIGNISSTNGKWEVSTTIVFKAKASRSAGGGDDGESWDTTLFIGHNKEFVRSSDTSEDEILVGSGGDISLITSVADWAAVSQWRSRCEQEHETCSERTAGEMPDHFRLIDVAKKRIIDADKNPPSFFALSYVWGAESHDEMELCQSNLDALQQPGSLHNLPQTIADAMHVCERLDQPYLWVDRFCIVQDNNKDKYGQIRSLEAIFSRAELVIIAACGENMQSDLAGVDGKSSRERNQISTKVFGFTMANKLQYFTRALNCKWNERGWTYQEAVLARRKLYFTSTEMWFECAKGLERENPFSTVSYKSRHGNHLTAYGSRDVQLTSDGFEEYIYHVRQYNVRVLTYPSDIYHAFRGIEDAFYPECQVVFGLPEFDFNRALLWQSRWEGNLKERLCSDRDIVLPSWSWASLTGSVTICTLFGDDPEWKSHYEGSFYCSLCSWATLGGKNQQTLVSINSIHDEEVWTRLDKLWSEDFYFSDHPTHRQFLALAWAKGCIEADVPTDLISSRVGAARSTKHLATRWSSIKAFWAKVRCQVRRSKNQSHETDFHLGRLQSDLNISAQDLASRWPTIQQFWADVRHREHQRKDNPQPIGLDKGQILTRTQSSMMNVGFRSVQHDNWTKDIFYIRRTNAQSGDDEIVGWISSESEYKLRGTVTPEGFANVDFIALAVGYMPEGQARELDEETLRKNRFHEAALDVNLQGDQPGVIVMAVRWTGQVAHRIALGWVTLQGWVDSKPDFRTVILA